MAGAEGNGGDRERSAKGVGRAGDRHAEMVVRVRAGREGMLGTQRTHRVNTTEAKYEKSNRLQCMKKEDMPQNRSTANTEAVSGVVIPSVVDEFLSERAVYWASAMAEDGPPVRVDLPALLEQLRRPSRGPTPEA